MQQQQKQQPKPFGPVRERAPSQAERVGGDEVDKERKQQKRTEYQVKAKTAKQKHARNVKSWFP